MQTLRCICFSALLLFSATTRAASPAPVAAQNGMVVTAQQHATRVGVDILKNGGNAIDAAIAVGYALAEHGFTLEQGDVDILAEGTEDFRKDPASAAIFLDRGQTRQAGAQLVQKDLARTLKAVSKDGAGGFYKGTVGQALITAIRG